LNPVSRYDWVSINVSKLMVHNNVIDRFFFVGTLMV
jgi:hypothetical protein